jgi:nitrogen fixation protein FixH
MKPETSSKDKSWPRGIFIAYTIFVSLTVGFVVFTFTVHYDLVVPDYYTQTLTFQEQIDKSQHMMDLSDPVTVEVLQNQIRVELPDQLLSQNPTGIITLYRPSNAQLDLQFTVNPDSSGIQWISGTALQSGYWTVKMTIVTSDKEYYGEYPIYLN